MSRRLTAGCCVLAALAALAGCGAAPESVAGDSPQATHALRAAAREATQRFFSRYVDGDGRVVRRDQGADTVSEGQAYALLLAAATGDERRLDLVWGWTKAHLQRPDGLLSSRWAAGSVADPQSATDADLDAAHALTTAGRRMHRGDLRRAGRRLARAVLAHETVGGGRARVLVAGPWAVSGRVVNPSYLAPRAYAVLGSATHDRAWAALRRSAGDMLRVLVAGERLPPDWAHASRARVTAMARPGAPAGEPARYGFDAVRVPIRMATACDRRSRRIAADLWPRLRANDPGLLARELDGAPAPGAVRHATGLVGAAAAAHAAGDGPAARRLLREAQQLDGASPTYYGAAWVALGRILLTTDLLADCPRR